LEKLQYCHQVNGKRGDVGVARWIPNESESKSDSEFYKEQALVAFARAEKAMTEAARAEFLEIAVQWLKLATEAANVHENCAVPMAAESASNRD
jgi:hypothetical protein